MQLRAETGKMPSGQSFSRKYKCIFVLWQHCGLNFENVKAILVMFGQMLYKEKQI